MVQNEGLSFYLELLRRCGLYFTGNGFLYDRVDVVLYKFHVFVTVPMPETAFQLARGVSG
jgi:hypothetical protein